MRDRMIRLLSITARRLCRAALRAVLTGLVFALCLAAASASLGLPVPGPQELLERFESVSHLADILS